MINVSSEDVSKVRMFLGPCTDNAGMIAITCSSRKIAFYGEMGAWKVILGVGTLYNFIIQKPLIIITLLPNKHLVEQETKYQMTQVPL